MIKVRVLNVDADKRLLELTKKDTFLKEDCPVYASHRDIKIGDELTSVVVAQNSFGYVVKSFGSLKGLLTFEDIRASKVKLS